MGPKSVWRLIVLSAIAVVVLGACRSTTANVTTTTTIAVVGDAAAGAELFADGRIACTACHTLEGISEGSTGPNLTTIATDVAARLTDGSYTGIATDVGSYLRESILDPRAFVAPDCPAGPCFDRVMPQTFADTLSPQEVGDLVAFLSTLR